MTALKPTDRVVYTSFGARRHGTVIKIAKAIATVRFDDCTEDRIPLGQLSLETAEDIARRDHEQAMREWIDRKPDTTIARATMSGAWGRTEPDGAEVLRASTPEEMRQGARELQELADWFEERPVKL